MGDEFSSIPAQKQASTAESPAVLVLNETRTQGGEHLLHVGFPVVCNICHNKMSSLVVVKHNMVAHGNGGGTLRSMAKLIPQREDSVYSNQDAITKNLVLRDDNNGFFSLEEKLNDQVWKAQSLPRKVIIELKILEDLVNMKILGMLEEEKESGIYVEAIKTKVKTFHEFSSAKQIFFT